MVYLVLQTAEESPSRAAVRRAAFAPHGPLPLAFLHEPDSSQPLALQSVDDKNRSWLESSLRSAPGFSDSPIVFFRTSTSMHSRSGLQFQFTPARRKPRIPGDSRLLREPATGRRPAAAGAFLLVPLMGVSVPPSRYLPGRSVKGGGRMAGGCGLVRHPLAIANMPERNSASELPRRAEPPFHTHRVRAPPGRLRMWRPVAKSQIRRQAGPPNSRHARTDECPAHERPYRFAELLGIPRHRSPPSAPKIPTTLPISFIRHKSCCISHPT